MRKFILPLITILTLSVFVASQSGIGGGQSNVGGGGGGVPGGSNTQVQFNNNGAFGGNAGFVLTSTGNPVILTLGQPAVSFGELQLNDSSGGSGQISTNGTGPIFANKNFNSPAFSTATNCSSSASPAVCASAASGSVVVAAAATTVQVNTTAVTANSQVQLTFDSSLGTKLSVTCNTTAVQPTVSARTGGTSFTITVPTAPTTNPACFSYTIMN